MEMIKVTQMIAETWTGTDGKVRTNILGLGDDGQVYMWHKGTGKWVLFLLTSN